MSKVGGGVNKGLAQLLATAQLARRCVCSALHVPVPVATELTAFGKIVSKYSVYKL